MGDKGNIFEDIEGFGPIVLIEYIEDGERKTEKGSPEKIIEIYKKIKANPETMKLEFIGPTE